jgi:transposase
MGAELAQEADVLRAQLDEMFDAVRQKDRTIQDLEERVRYLLQKLYGRKSEKVHPEQLALAFAERDLELIVPEIPSHADEAPDDESPREKQKKRSRRNGRVPLPEHLRRKRTEYHPDPEDLVCSCCQSAKERIGEEITEELEYEPASFLVKEHVRVKYACRACEEGVVIADPPALPIEKGRPGPGLLAHVVTSKYGDHLPLHRQTGIYRRHGVELHRSTLCDWVRDTAELLRPIAMAMKRSILETGYVNTDDTPVKVHQGKGGPGKTKQGRIWVYVSPERREAVYDFTTTRAGEGPRSFLSGFTGFLQADAYGGYDRLYTSGEVVEVGCHAHARRKFFDALDTAPEAASYVLALIRGLYDIEANARERGIVGPKLAELRAKESRRLLEGLREFLVLESAEALPQSPLGKAIGYALKQWEALTRYVTDGRLAIDNNTAENALRCVAVGRGNWIFCGSPAGGRRAAILYSLVVSCKLQGIDPFAYIRDVLTRIRTTPTSRIDELTPRGWKQAREESAASAAPTA